MATSLLPSVHVSKHPCLRAKLSQLRSKGTNARETKTLVHEIALLLGSEALSQLDLENAGTVSPSSSSSLQASLLINESRLTRDFL